MPGTVALDVVNAIKIAKPCPMDWERLSPVEGCGERVRHCSQCSLNVYNISELSAEEASQLILRHAASGERLCGAVYRRRDGTVITKDCPVGLAAVRQRVASWCSLAAAAVLTLASGALVRVSRAGDEWHPSAQTIAPVRTASEWLERKAREMLNLGPNGAGRFLGDIGFPRTPPNVPPSAQRFFWQESLKDV